MLWVLRDERTRMQRLGVAAVAGRESELKL